MEVVVMPRSPGVVVALQSSISFSDYMQLCANVSSAPSQLPPPLSPVPHAAIRTFALTKYVSDQGLAAILSTASSWYKM